MTFMAWHTKLSCVCALGAVVSLQSADWPQWQGPKRDSISPETGLLKEWPKGGPPLVWKSTGLGGGYNAPSVANGRVYGMGYIGEDEVVWALDLNGGKKIWTARIGPASHEFDYDQGPRATPTADGGLLFTLGGGGDLACLDNQTGKIQWHKNLKKDFGGKMMSGWGYSESPLVDGDKVICTPGGREGTLIALNKKTGELFWRTKDLTDDAAYSSAIVVEMGGVRQYIQLTPAHVVGVAADDGRLLWQANRRGSTAVIPTPVFHNNSVYVTSGYGAGCNLFKVSVNGQKFEAKEVYEDKNRRNLSNHHGGVVRIGDYIYGYGDGRGWVCQNFSTGEIVWAERSKLGKGSVSYADGRLYLRSEGGGGTLMLIEASPQGFHEYGHFDQPDRSSRNSWPHPVIADGKLFIRDQDVLLCYDIKAR